MGFFTYGYNSWIYQSHISEMLSRFYFISIKNLPPGYVDSVITNRIWETRKWSGTKEKYHSRLGNIISSFETQTKGKPITKRVKNTNGNLPYLLLCGTNCKIRCLLRRECLWPLEKIIPTSPKRLSPWRCVCHVSHHHSTWRVYTAFIGPQPGPLIVVTAYWFWVPMISYKALGHAQ